jgi:multidrug efflux pump subunit AcrA (membrane-fusion protein)
MRMKSLFSTAIALALAATASAAGPADPVLPNCLISVKDEVQVPAQEAGVLVELPAQLGMRVERGDVLGKIDDSERQMQKRLALIEQKAAREKAENDIDVRYASAASKVAESEYQQAVEANGRVRGAFPEAEVRRLNLAWHRAFLQIEQAQVEQKMAKYQAQLRAAEVEAAEANIRRRRIVAPVAGEVVELMKHEGEWVAPGDPVLRVARFDTLRIEGFLNATEYDPLDVANRPVTVEVELARGRRVQFTGQISYIDPRVQAGGEYRVWAEVANRREGDQWLLRPGLSAVMTVHVDATPVRLTRRAGKLKINR